MKRSECPPPPPSRWALIAPSARCEPSAMTMRRERKRKLVSSQHLTGHGNSYTGAILTIQRVFKCPSTACLHIHIIFHGSQPFISFCSVDHKNIQIESNGWDICQAVEVINLPCFYGSMGHYSTLQGYGQR